MHSSLRRNIAIAGSVVVEALLICYLRFRHFEILWIIALCALAAISLAVHVRKFAEDAAYPLHLAGWEKSKDLGIGRSDQARRIGQYDYLRVIAVAGVIITHAVQTDLSEIGSTGRPVAQVIWVLAMAANTIYVMISAALLFGWRKESIREFFVKRFGAVVIPMVLYLLWYISVIYRFGRGDKWISPKQVIHWIVARELSEVPHYWLIYVILSIYLVVPLARLLTKDVDYKAFTKALGALALFQIISNLLLATYADVAVDIPLAGWFLVALYGYWASLPETRKYDRLLMIAGLFAGIGICIIALFVQENDILNLYCLNDAPMMCILCVGIIAFVFHFKKLFDNPGRIIHSISKYSYGIILIHWWSFFYQAKGRFHISSETMPVLWLPVTVIVVIIVSWIFSFIMDNLIVMPFKLLINRILKK